MIRVMVFNAPFSNILVISWSWAILMEVAGGSGENLRAVASHWQIYHIMLYPVHLVWAVFEHTTLVVIGTDYLGSYASNYHPITSHDGPLSIRFCNCHDDDVLFFGFSYLIINKGNNKITELRTILQRESKNS